MAKRTRLKSTKGRLRSTSLGRTSRLKASKKIVSRQELSDLLETDVFEDLEVSEQEIEKLQDDGWEFVVSSNVKAVKLISSNDKPKLNVMFGDNSIYEWVINAEALYTGLLSSTSKGRAIRQLGMYATHSRKIR